MDGSELFDKTLRVKSASNFYNLKFKNDPVWKNTDEYVRELKKRKIREEVSDKKLKEETFRKIM